MEVEEQGKCEDKHSEEVVEKAIAAVKFVKVQQHGEGVEEVPEEAGLSSAKVRFLQVFKGLQRITELNRWNYQCNKKTVDKEVSNINWRDDLSLRGPRRELVGDSWAAVTPEVVNKETVTADK